MLTTSPPSPPPSTADPARPSTGKHPPRPSTSYCRTRQQQAVLRPPLEPKLHPTVAVMDQVVQAGVLTGPDGHLQGVQRQGGPQRGGDPPADDGAAVGVDDERGVAEPR